MDYHIVELASGKCEQVAVFTSLDDALSNHQHFTAVYPDGVIEVLSTDELIALQQTV
jgi:Uma2 family endonuclease